MAIHRWVLAVKPLSLKVIYIRAFNSIGIGIFLALLNLILGILTLSYLHPKKEREFFFLSSLPTWDLILYLPPFSSCLWNSVSQRVTCSLSLLFSLLPVRTWHVILSSLAHVVISIILSLQRAKEEMTDRYPSYTDTGYAIGVVVLFVSKLWSKHILSSSWLLNHCFTPKKSLALYYQLNFLVDAFLDKTHTSKPSDRLVVALLQQWQLVHG